MKLLELSISADTQSNCLFGNLLTGADLTEAGIEL